MIRPAHTRRWHAIGLSALVIVVAALGWVLFRALLQIEKTPLAIEATRSFPELRLPRPVIFTNAGDGTNRIFVGSGPGMIHVFPNQQNVTDASTFLDIEKQVVCQGEEGLLGLAFHPHYRQNGEFFVYYSTAASNNTSVVSRFHVSTDDPNKAEANSEEEIMRIEHSGLHIGGSLAFGPDGYLYIGLGDGGGPKDVHGSGQNLETLLGSILRIDVDHRDPDKHYAVPADNPFVGTAGARPEIWAYGLRNVWRMSFDRETGMLWAGDVGEDTWEEVNIIVRGGNYGWSLREGKHPFGPKGSSPRADLIEPIWEYDRSVGMCITGGVVYRGKSLPELRGAYLFADYVANKAWALRYDQTSNRVLSVKMIGGIKDMPIVTFGEDEEGEVYFTDLFGRIFALARIDQR